MTLSEWLRRDRTRTAKLALHLGKTPGCIRHWARSARQRDPSYARAIEDFTGGEVRAEDYRPDLEWVRINGVVTHYQVAVATLCSAPAANDQRSEAA